MPRLKFFTIQELGFSIWASYNFLTLEICVVRIKVRLTFTGVLNFHLLCLSLAFLDFQQLGVSSWDECFRLFVKEYDVRLHDHVGLLPGSWTGHLSCMPLKILASSLIAATTTPSTLANSATNLRYVLLKLNIVIKPLILDLCTVCIQVGTPSFEKQNNVIQEFPTSCVTIG